MARQRKADEVPFRWRGGEITRLEAFSDAVFAFAVTLLIVSLEVPRTFTDLLHAMHGFFAFAICFAVLITIWHSHYTFFRRYGLQDGWTIALNSALLFVVLFYIYPLKFLFGLWIESFSSSNPVITDVTGKVVPVIQANQIPQLMIVYGAGYIAVYLILGLMFWHAWNLRQSLELNRLEEFDTWSSLIKCVLSGSVGVVSIGLTLFGGRRFSWLAGLCYPVLISALMTFHGWRSGRARRKISDELQQGLHAA